MFMQNEGRWDRVIRFVVGAVLVYVWYAALVTGLLATVLLVIGLVLLITSVIGWCPLYTVLGLRTRSALR